MRISLLSDLHFEFDGDFGKEFISGLNSEGVDVLVLAGDITIPSQMFQTLDNICNHYKNSQIIYILGNHDHAHVRLNKIKEIIKTLSLQHQHFTWLENDIKEINCLNSKGNFETKRFLGCTLWYPPTATAQKSKYDWFDFQYIPNADPYIFIQNKKSINFLKNNIREGDIVVTHMQPS